MSLVVVTPRYAEPVSLAEARLHLKADGTEDDALIAGWIVSAADYAEHETQQPLVATKYRQGFEGFLAERKAIVLDRGPVVSVVSVQYVDSAGDTQTLATADYQVDLDALPCRIVPAYGASWPSTREQLAAVSVTYIAGHAAPFSANAVADTITVQGWKALAVNDGPLRFTNSGGALPAGLTAATDYYVKTAPGGGVYTLSLTVGGATVDITGAGTGTHFLGAVPEAAKSWMKVRMGGLDQLREEAARSQLQPHPYMDRLLDPLRYYGWA